MADALDLHIRHRDTAKHFARILEASAAQVDATAFRLWRRGVKAPRASRSLAALELIYMRFVEGQSIIDDYLRRTFKPTERIIESNAAFFAGLRQIDKIFVMGHSLSSVDHAYFHEVIGNVDISGVKWKISYFRDVSEPRLQS